MEDRDAKIVIETLECSIVNMMNKDARNSKKCYQSAIKKLRTMQMKMELRT